MRLIDTLRGPGGHHSSSSRNSRNHWWLLVCATLVCATTITGCSSGSSNHASAPASSRTVTLIPDSPSLTNPSLATPGLPAPVDDPFYQVPPGYASTKPGTVLKSRPLTLSPAFKATWSSSGGYQLLYRTTDVTRISYRDRGYGPPPNPPGSRSKESRLRPDCRGQSHNQLCSVVPDTAGSASLSLFFDNVMIGSALANGWDVVISDYEGPRSELLVGPLEGRETLDGIRAAEGFSDDGLNGAVTKVGLEGYSGGSVPTIWAGSLAAGYAPKLDVVGIAAGGVAADPNYITAHIDHSLLFGGVILGLVGVSRAYPELHLGTILNARGLQVAAKDARDGYGCGLGVTSFAGGTAAHFTNFSTSQALAQLPAIVKVTDQLSAVSAPAPHAPVYLYNTVNDEIMRIAQVDALYAAYCRAGARVSYDRSIVGEHISGITTFGLTAPLYLAARFAGTRAPVHVRRPPERPKQIAAGPGSRLLRPGFEHSPITS